MKMKKKKYPRYFIGKKDDWTITKYVYIKKDLVVRSILKGGEHNILYDWTERKCEEEVQSGIWREVMGAELVLII